VESSWAAVAPRRPAQRAGSVGMLMPARLTAGRVWGFSPGWRVTYGPCVAPRAITDDAPYWLSPQESERDSPGGTLY